MKTLKIIKIGGNVIDDETALQSFLKDFSKIRDPKILVHGGGKIATQLAQRMDIPVTMVNGRRITDVATLDIITMVYAGKINKQLVAGLQANACNAIGFSGADGNSVVSSKRPVKTIDYGFVGDLQHVNVKTLQLLLNHGITPVFCAITHDAKGQLLNTNADTIASELAIAFSETFITELYYCFEKKGVLKDVSDDNSVIATIKSAHIEQLINAQVISEGMLPKITNCLKAISNNVQKVCIGKPDMLFKKTALFTTITK